MTQTRKLEGVYEAVFIRVDDQLSAKMIGITWNKVKKTRDDKNKELPFCHFPPIRVRDPEPGVLRMYGILTGVSSSKKRHMSIVLLGGTK